MVGQRILCLLMTLLLCLEEFPALQPSCRDCPLLLVFCVPFTSSNRKDSIFVELKTSVVDVTEKKTPHSCDESKFPQTK
ncbi:hypothetical protein TNCV_2131321 [Trichonephila clavipes]|nr:hypothetical protein TNCV_2131321 [Trichonephila clavipes]